MLKQRGTRLVLGLRDVMDEPKLLVPEWQRKKVVPALRDLYDEIWIYGLPQICEPLAGITCRPACARRSPIPATCARGVDRRRTPRARDHQEALHPGHDRRRRRRRGMIDWVLRAYEHDPLLPYPALAGAGPVHAAGAPDRVHEPRRQAQAGRRDHLPQQPGSAGGRASGVVAMGGYNTFCEVLSLRQAGADHSAHQAALEQFIRASSAARSWAWSACCSRTACAIPSVMATALRAIAAQNLPSQVVVPGLLEGCPTWPSWSRPGSTGAEDEAGQGGGAYWLNAAWRDRRGPRRLCLKGYPRLSETFIAQEIAALERGACRS
jgi:predicted glycosyltransferase